MSQTNSADKPRRRTSIALIVSLCLNVALLALIGAAVSRVMHRDTEIGAGGILAPRSVIAAVPQAQALIQKIIDAHAQKLRALRMESVRTRKDAFAVLAASDYTPAKFAGALGAVHAADSALEGESITMMAESLSALTPAQRLVVVDRVRRRTNSWFFRTFRPRPRE